jgi:hypothetical protein
MKLSFIAFPGTSFSARTTTPSSCAGTALHLAAPATGSRRCPNRRSPQPEAAVVPDGASGVAAPAFGDYGGMPMQILWALLDIATIIVLNSGLYLWLSAATRCPPRQAG